MNFSFRAMAVCVSMMAGRFGSVISANIIGVLLEQNCELTYYLSSGVVLTCLAVSFIIPKKAKHLSWNKFILNSFSWFNFWKQKLENKMPEVLMNLLSLA